MCRMGEMAAWTNRVLVDQLSDLDRERGEQLELAGLGHDVRL
jgi:hypothetical protein